MYEKSDDIQNKKKKWAITGNECEKVKQIKKERKTIRNQTKYLIRNTRDREHTRTWKL